ncbi:DNA-binding transcriptional regulator, LacI/PurR family [Cyclonatronum proteinivorum]|uniref:DNA-binding transcriptional regulator, LacI/PurR family n=1 Tax=Cyclonatronum proteinivorum TaxID=1457365 RepID=A0A345UJU0_9BACT|nr:LacI family DNA-binding transcriptional regulator [Cyclonatronum proteinivorum]AXJ00742.1 DNA-binding transcriptional regulator, LacI/PurR family [Cyclonatronum proteinivorum]
MIKKVTLKHIAEDTGLSISTVSRALTRTGKISKENEKRIYESAYRLNYPVSSIHTPIELRNTIQIAIVTRHYTGEFFASLFEGFDLAAKDTNAGVSLMSVTHTSDSPDEIVSELRKTHFDAAVIFMPDYGEAEYEVLLNSFPAEFPLVSIAPIASPVMDTVTFDSYRGGHLVAKHFEERGYQKLGVIQGPINKSEAMLRKNGFLDYINASDNLSLVWEYCGDYSFAKGKAGYYNYKDAPVKPEAIFCTNDSMAVGFMHNAIRDGLIIPNDVAIAGYDDLPTCNLYTPTLSSVHTPYDSLGQKTIEIIINRLKEQSSARHTGYISLVPVSLSVRESTTSLSRIFKNPYKTLV